MITRFAPSPTGPLHLGHAYSAMLAHDMARAVGGDFLLRTEDIDQTRARPEWEAQIYDDLRWLGLTWDGPVLRQSDRTNAYRDALTRLWKANALYPCSCNRRDILAAAAPHEGEPTMGPDGILYPRTCADIYAREGVLHSDTPLPDGPALRLNMDRAMGHAMTYRIDAPHPDGFACFTETGRGPDGQTGLIEFTATEVETTIGDVVLSRRGTVGSYHLSVVLDDAAQGVTHVIRGADLFEATKIHVIVQAALGLPKPIYHHHRLIRDDTGKRLAKRDDARAIAKYRADGASPEDIRRLVGL